MSEEQRTEHINLNEIKNRVQKIQWAKNIVQKIQLTKY